MNIERNNKLWLPRTGQTTSYATGDDGYFQAGNPRATRFVDNGNGTINDRATGLMWVKEPGEIGTVGGYNWGAAGSPNTFTWANALLAIAALNANGGHGGYSDWRLPNLFELFSLYRANVAAPPIDTASFPSTQSASYWTGTAHGTASAYKSICRYSQPYPDCSVATSVATLNYVRPVRGGRINANW